MMPWVRVARKDKYEIVNGYREKFDFANITIRFLAYFAAQSIIHIGADESLAMGSNELDSIQSAREFKSLN